MINVPAFWEMVRAKIIARIVATGVFEDRAMVEAVIKRVDEQIERGFDFWLAYIADHLNVLS